MADDHEPGFSAVARDHAMYPRHLGPPQSWGGRARITGPCGDTMEFWVTVEDGCVKRVSFTTDGCGSSLAWFCGGQSLGSAVQTHKRPRLLALSPTVT